MKMTRTNFYFPAAMLKRLRAASKGTGLKMSWMIRKAITDYLDKHHL